MSLTRSLTIGVPVVLITLAGAIGLVVLRGDDTGGLGRQIVVTPVRDTYVSQSKPDESYGNARQLRADNGPQAVQAYLHFEVPAVTGQLNEVSLRLHANAPDSTGLFVAPVTAVPWSEEMTWRTAIPVGDPTAQGHPVGADGWVEIDVRSLVRGPGPLDLALLNPGDTMVNYSSRESGPHTAPRLVLVMDG
jgi:hypothetical protein